MSLNHYKIIHKFRYNKVKISDEIINNYKDDIITKIEAGAESIKIRTGNIIILGQRVHGMEDLIEILICKNYIGEVYDKK